MPAWISACPQCKQEFVLAQIIAKRAAVADVDPFEWPPKNLRSSRWGEARVSPLPGGVDPSELSASVSTLIGIKVNVCGLKAITASSC